MSMCRYDDSPWCPPGTCKDCDEGYAFLNPKCPCEAHPRYEAKAKPRSTCEACWRFFVRMNP